MVEYAEASDEEGRGKAERVSGAVADSALEVVAENLASAPTGHKCTGTRLLGRRGVFHGERWKARVQRCWKLVSNEQHLRSPGET